MSKNHSNHNNHKNQGLDNKKETMNTKTYKKFALLPLLMLLLGGLMLNSCSKEDDDTSSSTLIKQYGLTGKYRFSVSPAMAGIVVATGTVDGTIIEEGNGVLRLRFSGFQASPMPFEMSVDTQFTVTETPNGLMIHNVNGKSYFDANPPAGGADPNDNDWNLPPEALEQGLHSNGNSIVNGVYKNSTKKLELELDPAVQLPVKIKINTVQKLN